MRFLVDECVGPAVAAWLRARGHQVFSVYDEAPGSSDEAIATRARDGGWILVTSDLGFGDLVFRRGQAHAGTVLLRLDDERPAVKIEALRRLLDHHGRDLSGSFVVVSETKIRIARPGR